MARILFHGRSGALRLYDGGSPPKYLEVPFSQMNFSAPLARPRTPDPIVPTVGGYAHLPGADYEQGFAEPQEVSFSCHIDDTTNSWKLRDAMCNVDLHSPWTVGSQTWTSAKGQGGSIILANGGYAPTPGSFYDNKKVSVHIETLWTHNQTTSGTPSYGLRLNDVYMPPQDQQIQESADYVDLSIRGLVYGEIKPIGAFTSGTAS